MGGSAALPVVLSNSGTSPITISGRIKNAPWYFAAKGMYVPYTLSAGESVTFNVVYTPTNTKTSSGNFTFASNAANSSLVVTMQGTGGAGSPLAASPLSLSFGSVPVGTSSSQSLTVKNTSASSVTLTQVAPGSGSTGFTVSGITPPVNLPAGSSVTFQAIFSPSLIGNASSTIALATSAGTKSSVAASGVGAKGGQLSVTPTSVSFGGVVVGTSKSQSASVSASGAAVTITSQSVSDAQFSLGGLALPLTLNPGQSVPFTVTFQPQSNGPANASVTFGTGVSSSMAAASLSGTGMAPPQHNVSLSWQPSTSTVAGYNVYRGSQAGGPYVEISSSLNTGTSYSDSTVQAGTTYYYVVTATDNSGNESAYSNTAQAVVPTP